MNGIFIHGWKLPEGAKIVSGDSSASDIVPSKSNTHALIEYKQLLQLIKYINQYALAALESDEAHDAALEEIWNQTERLLMHIQMQRISLLAARQLEHEASEDAT